ncbi:MAG: putative toxin-antitoxin system toxin component, PIN family [Dehalococcoidia bacterium]|nr:putative toxin-antitoxin system toxin component, PIN family [Dehalococcoidia bacterium]
MRVVLDTVVFVRALINPHGKWGRLLFELSDRYVLVLSPDIIREIISVLYRPSLRRRFPQMAEPAPLAQVLAILERAEVVEPAEKLSVCRDPNDDKFFECALEGRALFIVSEDKDVLGVGEFLGIKPVTADLFLQLLQG